MSKKFTEEQYHKIVFLQEIDYKFSILEDNGGISFWRGLINVEKDLAVFVGKNKLLDELAALANPITREWAHEQFVEKEKKYVWELKSDNDLAISNLNGQWFLDKTPSDIECFSEAEIENSPFKPEWFDKEEVD